MDLLADELAGAILASAAATERNLMLNRMALVGRSWHALLAPQTEACIPALTRCDASEGLDAQTTRVAHSLAETPSEEIVKKLGSLSGPIVGMRAPGIGCG